mmetsp:Transcript_11764/g.25835  ORF Transcript_11764/g.25835 Transcript_11764/m.25835 type:complete len:98 (-) Transcript_11764:615-908(-)
MNYDKPYVGRLNITLYSNKFLNTIYSFQMSLERSFQDSGNISSGIISSCLNDPALLSSDRPGFSTKCTYLADRFFKIRYSEEYFVGGTELKFPSSFQ